MKKYVKAGLLIWIIGFGFSCAAWAKNDQAVQKSNDQLSANLTGISVKAQQNAVAVSWGTSQEYDNEDFVVQRSEDNANWKDIGLIHGTGGGLWPVSYCFVDTNINEALLYYRVKVVNGKSSSLSETVSIKKQEDQEPSTFAVYPNPAKNAIWIKPLQAGATGEELYIFNSRGEQVYNVKLKEPDQRIDLGDFKPGFYYVKIGTQLHKIYKQQ